MALRLGLRHTLPDSDVAQPDSILRLWLLRILVPLNAQREFICSHGFNNDALAAAIGLGHWIAPSSREFDPKAAQTELRKLHQKAEKQAQAASLPATLRENVRRLSDLVGLSATDCRILEFAVLINNERLLDDTADGLGQLSSAKVFHSISVILDLAEAEVRSSLSAQGILVRSGLVSVDRSRNTTLSNKLHLLSDDFADLMASAVTEPINLLRGTVSSAEPAHLSLADFNHLQASLDILLPYLRHTRMTARRGVNIFIHGAPGTGKTQLVRALAKHLEYELFEVAWEDADGRPEGGTQRLRGFQVAQSFFAQNRSLIAFDEAEDVFDDGDIFSNFKSTAQNRKAWLNRMLEDNPVPTIWLSNTIKGIDPAFIRRFDMVLELPIPPKNQRERILRALCDEYLDTASVSRLAETETLAPAVVAKANAVVRTIRHDLGQEGSVAAFERLISNTLEAQGHRPLVQNDPNRLPDIYDPDFIHADADLARVADGLIAARAGRLCLYGPPGTGKTAYGRWLARQLESPLLVKQASDLMSPYVGLNEQNIARTFRQAEDDGAVLFIDEIDSFLQDRRSAQRGWEVSMVNEMLTQLESFPGVFIAATNLMNGLDQAALRRFDLKVKFDFLRAEQVWELLCRYCKHLGFALPQPELQTRVWRMKQLAPGDFAAVMRQHRFRPIESVDALIAALETECAMKEGGKAPMGFL